MKILQSQGKKNKCQNRDFFLYNACIFGRVQARFSMIHVCVCFALPRAILHDYFIGNVFVYPYAKARQFNCHWHCYVSARNSVKVYVQKNCNYEMSRSIEAISLINGLRSKRQLVLLLSVHTCVFYSIPNSPRGGERENGSTLLQTVLHWFEALRVMFCGAQRGAFVRQETETRSKEEREQEIEK